MKKTIIAAAVAASVAAPAAFAEVTVYGKIHQATNNFSDEASITKAATTVVAAAGVANASIGSLRAVDGTASALGTAMTTLTAETQTDNDDTTNMGSNASRFGVKGTEDLGNGMSAFFQMEWSADSTDGNAMGAARDAFVGLKGDFGKLTVGRLGGPTKGMLYASTAQISDSHSGNDFASNFKSKGDRVNNAIAYSNSFGAMDVTVAAVGTDGADGNHAGGKSAGVSFEAAPGLKINAAWLDSDNNGKDTTLFGASYKMGDLKVAAVYENAGNLGTDFEGYEMDRLFVATDHDTKTMGLTASYTMGNNVLSVAYAKGDTDFDHGNQATFSADADTKYTAINFMHKMSKRTSLYASYMDKDVDLVADDSAAVLQDFTMAIESNNTSVGIIHTF